MLGDYGKPFYANPYLHPLVFGINLDSVLNDIGMLLACGVVKKITCESVQNMFSTATVRGHLRKNGHFKFLIFLKS